MRLHQNQRGSAIFSGLKSTASYMGSFFRNLTSSFKRFDNKERIIFFALALTLVVLLVMEGIKLYHDNTELAAAPGGEYVEVLSGEAKYFTPVLARNDAERAITRLVYSSLVKIDENNQPQPDLASSWEVSTDGLVYTFHLRSGVVFQKGQSFESDDVAATILAIKDDANKSPLEETWANINVETPDPSTVIFRLPKSYGPFIYNCTLAIIDRQDAISGSLSSSYNGTGPYSLVQATPDGNNNLTVLLKAYSGYYAGQPLITNMRFLIAKDNISAERLSKELSPVAYAGLSPSSGSVAFADKSFQAGRNLILFFNFRKDSLKSLETRRKIIANEALDSTLKLTLLSLNTEPQKGRAESFAQSWKDKNLDITLRAVSATEYSEAVKKRDYDLLMYGYDWGYDTDPYILWHSSQLDISNFSGYSDKASDIMLEDARLVLDSAARSALYDAFYEKVRQEALAIYYSPEKYPYYVNDIVKDVQLGSSYGRPEDRFNNPGNWYIKEKRVRK